MISYNHALNFIMSQESHSISSFNIPEIIRKKRDGEELSDAEITQFIKGLMSGEVADYQMSALLMAIYLKGMTGAETRALTDAMLYSGEVLQFESPLVVDKHSTGGVGDKASFILGPLAAACGVKVPMMAGRGLGHTGGTVDKIEAITGYKTDISLQDFKAMVLEHGFSLIGQTKTIAPADKKIYALRDVTSTVESIPLITASIMSKKLAEGANSIVMDVKTGNGAFMSKKSDARLLSKSLMDTAKRFNRQMSVTITDMSQPLGRMVGHSLELIECFETLKGKGPKDLTDLSVELAAHMVLLAKIEKTMALARKKVRHALESGSGLAQLRNLIDRHGGDTSVIENYERLDIASAKTVFYANKPGYLAKIKTKDLGLAVLELGGGRTRADQKIDFAVGLECHARLGSKMTTKTPLVTLYHHPHQQKLVDTLMKEKLSGAFSFSKNKVKSPPLIYDVLSTMGKGI
jgi:pyrimidine-nucleoside phosphorylase